MSRATCLGSRPSLVPKPNASQLRVDYITATLAETLAYVFVKTMEFYRNQSCFMFTMNIIIST